MTRSLRLDRLPKAWEGRVHGESVPAKAHKPLRLTRYANKWEQRYADCLDAERTAGLIRRWHYNSVRLKLGEGAWFMPDFYVVQTDGTIRMDEVKGFFREAAKVRIRVAATLYPELHFRVMVWDHGSHQFVERAFA